MRIRTLICLIIINIVLCFNAYSFHYPVAKVTLKVVDDEGKPVEGARIYGGFWAMGYPDDGPDFKGITDKEGKATFKGETHGEMSYIVRKEGYYNTDGEYKKFELNKDKTKWYPWNPIIKVVLKRKKNPIPMYKKGVCSNLPPNNVRVGYDLIKGDWVKPYGKGEVSDFIFKINEKIINEDEFEYTLELTFSNEKDGIMEYYVDDKQKSEFYFPYKAPLNGYKNKFVETYGWNRKIGAYDTLENVENVNFIFRVRTKTDGNGNIIKAMYGMILGKIKFGEGVDFYYILNPTGTRNLETDLHENFDNLFKIERENDEGGIK